MDDSIKFQSSAYNQGIPNQLIIPGADQYVRFFVSAERDLKGIMTACLHVTDEQFHQNIPNTIADIQKVKHKALEAAAFYRDNPSNFETSTDYVDTVLPANELIAKHFDIVAGELQTRTNILNEIKKVAPTDKSFDMRREMWLTNFRRSINITDTCDDYIKAIYRKFDLTVKRQAEGVDR